MFGLGLIDSITDMTIGNDGTVTRFGWKAQNKSLLLFSGEAYNVEIGVTNELFPTERSEDPKCATNHLPEDHTGFDMENEPANIVAFMAFMRFMDQPTPACGTTGQPCSQSVVNGQALFESIGCSGCHTPSLTTGLSVTDALNHQQANLFSDLALHHMGPALPITSSKATPARMNFARLLGGVSVNGHSSRMMAERAIY